MDWRRISTCAFPITLNSPCSLSPRCTGCFVLCSCTRFPTPPLKSRSKHQLECTNSTAINLCFPRPNRRRCHYEPVWLRLVLPSSTRSRRSRGLADQIYRTSPNQTACLCQGEILSDLVQHRLDEATLDSASPIIEPIHYQFAIVLTQACDLSQDFACRQSGKPPQLPDVLFCQVPTAEELKSRNNLNSRIWDRIKINKDERYHFLEAVPVVCDALGNGLPEMAIDFKRYFTIPTPVIYLQLQLSASRRCRLCSPYLEHLSTRFAYFLSRVALPSEHASI